MSRFDLPFKKKIHVLMCLAHEWHASQGASVAATGTADPLVAERLAALTGLLDTIGFPLSRYPEIEAAVATGMETQALGTQVRGGSDDDRDVLIPGDIARSMEPRHTGRYYLITDIVTGDTEAAIENGGVRVIWGRRYVPARRTTSGQEEIIKWPLQRIGANPDFKRRDKPHKDASFGVTPFAVGDLVEDSGSKHDQLRNRYRITRLGGPSMYGRVLFGRRVIRRTGVVMGSEVQITWPIRKVEGSEPGVRGPEPATWSCASWCGICRQGTRVLCTGMWTEGATTAGRAISGT